MVLWEAIRQLCEVVIVLEHVVAVGQPLLVAALAVVGHRMMPLLTVSVVVTYGIPGLSC